MKSIFFFLVLALAMPGWLCANESEKKESEVDVAPVQFLLKADFLFNGTSTLSSKYNKLERFSGVRSGLLKLGGGFNFLGKAALILTWVGNPNKIFTSQGSDDDIFTLFDEPQEQKFSSNTFEIAGRYFLKRFKVDNIQPYVFGAFTVYDIDRYDYFIPWSELGCIDCLVVGGGLDIPRDTYYNYDGAILSIGYGIKVEIMRWKSGSSFSFTPQIGLGYNWYEFTRNFQGLTDLQEKRRDLVFIYDFASLEFAF